MNIVLVNPEIPQNTGGIGRLCVCTGSSLHLIKPLGFEIDEKKVRRAGMDYWKHLDLHLHENWQDFLKTVNAGSRFHFCSTKTEKNIYQDTFKEDDYIVFGNESSGFPKEFYQEYQEDLVTIPMDGEFVRSLNLANSAAIVVYEAMRQIKYSS